MRRQIAVIYHSVTGTTGKLADAIVEGVESIEGTVAIPYSIQGADIIDGRFKNEAVLEIVTESAGVIFGSPTFMGCVSAQFKAFADASSDHWVDKKWSGKLCAGFTIGSNLSGDQLNTIQYLQVLSNQHGMLWVSIDIPGGFDPLRRNRLGSQGGLIAQTMDSNIDSSDRETAAYLGKRVAKLAGILAN